MRKFTTVLLLLFACISSASGFHARVDSLRPGLPLHFTANAGQWDQRVRYALLAGASTIWFCDNEIVMDKPREKQSLVDPERQRITESGTRDIIRLQFATCESRPTIEALDTLAGVANFYVGQEKSAWRTSVSIHRKLRYRNVIPGVDLDIQIQQPGTMRKGEKEIDRNSQNIQLRLISGEASSTPAIPIAVTTNGTQRTSYLDCSELAAYLATVDFDQGTYYIQIKTEGGYGYIDGSTRNPDFPVKNAYQGELRGEWDEILIKYDIRDRELLYSTYIGAPYDELAGAGSRMPDLNAYIAISEGRLYAARVTSDGFPQATGLPGTIETSPAPGPRSVIFALDEGGQLFKSAYFGGPGFLIPLDIQVSKTNIYVYAGVVGDTINQITPDAIESKAVIHQAPGGFACGYLAVFNKSLDSILYGTYIDPSTTRGNWGSDKSTKMEVGADGTIYIVRNKSVSDKAKGILVNAAMTADDIHEHGAYIMAISPDLHSYRYATWFGFPDRYFEFQSFLIHSDGDFYVTGLSAIFPEEQTQPPPAFVRRYPVASGCTYGLVIARFSNDGVLQSASEICSNGFQTSCTGLIESMCSGVIWAGTGDAHLGLHDTLQFALINPFDSVSIAPPDWNDCDNILLELDPSTLTPYYCSYWNHRHATQQSNGTTAVSTRPNGWVYYSSDPIARHIPLQPDWYMFGNINQRGFYAADVRIPTPCWTILCDLRTIDTVRVERRRGYSETRDFDVDYLVSNASPSKEARILKSWITIPNGLELIVGADTQAMIPALIGPGESASAFWRLRVTDPALLGDTASIRCRVMYVDPESGYDYPAPEELCEKEILVVPYDEPDPLLECVIDGLDSLYWQSPGLATSSTGAPGPARYIVTITNRDIDPVPIASFHLRMGEHCSIIGDTVRPGLTLAPGSSHIIIVEVDVDALRFSREIVLEAEAWDLYDLVIHSCRKETFVPGALDLYCSTRGTTRIEWYPASGITIPSSVMLNMDLENPLDTVRSSISVHVDLAAAPHLALLPGDSLVRGPFDVTSRGVKSPSWRFAFTNPPSVDVHDTIVYSYSYDGLVGQCMHIIAIEIVDKSVLCSLAAADTVSEAEVLSHAPVALQYVLRNIGTVPVTVDRNELAISPGTGLTTDDPLLRPGGMIAPGMDIQLNWSMRLQILRTARVATCTVTSYVGDSVLSVCTADIFLPGIDGLRCAITATDSLRFERDSLRYNPDPVSVRLDLSNILDSEETLIEAEIDLIRASRFVLAAGENTLKTLSRIDSHATAAITWLLTPQPGPTDETQDIRIRYRSTEQGVWKECTKSIVIEAWPEIAEVRCATGGHDSLHADQSYEDIVPKPFQVFYTATNSGTVTLTNCTAAIILPVGFACADSDSIQSYGSLAPGETVKRWWTLTTTVQLSSFGPYEFQWQWKSDEQGTVTGCVHTVQLVPDPSGGIVFTPLHLYFEADMGGTLPTAQNIQLWTGGGLSMPWTAQSDTWYIDLDPVTGDHTTTIAVRPNTTMLNKGMHESGITLAGSAQNLPKRIAVYYQITSTTGTGQVAVPAALALGPVYPHPVPLTSEARIFVSIPEGESFRLALYDLLGRQRALLHDGVAAGAEVLLPKPVSLGFEPGMYLLRLTSGRDIATRMIAVMK